jgi:serine/threonine-protein kinase
MSEPLVGDKIDQYELLDLLARSGMASIFKAKDTSDGQIVALKIPHIQFESDVVFFERFKREEIIGQKLDHPNICKVLRPKEKTRMYIAMEYVQGRSLRAMLQEKTPLPLDRALAIAIQLCEALVYLHGQGVVHRDLKPENILLTPEGNVKLLDFGIALDASARRMTWFGLSNTIGTPDYMAPEQVGGRRGDARTDVYSVGVMLYEMLTLHLPHESPNPHVLMRAKTTDEPTPPTIHEPGVSPQIEAILLKALERVPRDRYANAEAFLVDLRNPSAVPPRDAEIDRTRRRRIRIPSRVAVPVIIVILLAGLLALVSASHRKPGHAPHAAAPTQSR